MSIQDCQVTHVTCDVSNVRSSNGFATCFRFVCRWYLRQKPVGGGVRQVVSPPLPFPFPFPSSFPFPLSFQTNQWEGRSDPVRGKFPGFPPTYTTLSVCSLDFSERVCCAVNYRAPFCLVLFVCSVSWLSLLSCQYQCK